MIAQLWQKDISSVFSNSGRVLKTENEDIQGLSHGFVMLITPIVQKLPDSDLKTSSYIPSITTQFPLKLIFKRLKNIKRK